MPHRNVIPFPTTPPFAVPRKRGARSHADLQARVVSNLPLLMERTYTEIAKLWRRQVPIGWIAKMHQLSVCQVEACLWVSYNAPSVPGDELAGHDIAARRAA